MGMRLVTKKLLPSNWASHSGAVGVLGEVDIRITKRSRLRAKVLLFDTPRNMRKSWKQMLGKELGRGSLGAVNGLSCEYSNPSSGYRYMEADATYFAIVGLCKEHLGMEIISHEAVHVGYAYHKRVARSPFASVDEFDEERIAYPAGRAAAAMNRWLHDGGWYA